MGRDVDSVHQTRQKTGVFVSQTLLNLDGDNVSRRSLEDDLESRRGFQLINFSLDIVMIDKKAD